MPYETTYGKLHQPYWLRALSSLGWHQEMPELSTAPVFKGHLAHQAHFQLHVCIIVVVLLAAILNN